MSAQRKNWHEWIEAFRQQVPPDLHPAGASWVHEWIGDMHAAADCGDAEAIKHLAAKVQDKIADEEDWDAQKLAYIRQSLSSAGPHEGIL